MSQDCTGIYYTVTQRSTGSTIFFFLPWLVIPAIPSNLPLLLYPGALFLVFIGNNASSSTACQRVFVVAEFLLVAAIAVIKL